MVRISRKKAFLYKISDLVIIVASALIGLMSFINDVDSTDKWIENRPYQWHLIEWIQGYAVYFFIALFLISIFFTIVKKTKNPWIWEQIQFILDQYQDRVFNHISDDPRDHNRVTLFQVKKRCFLKKHWSSKKTLRPSGKHPRFSSYLVPVLRSGHLSKKTNALFYVSDKSDECEGIAGQAWGKGGTTVATDLPELKYDKNNTPSRRSINNYARATYSDLKLVDQYIENKRITPRSIAAIPVEVNGEPWGVVVLDSRRPHGVTDNSVQNYTLTVSMIGRLLEQA
ncbi:MAG: hypothetical protein ACTIM4_06960 [Marinomonas sp.]